jgi:uncharacterized protein (TIGR02145 family)
MKTKTFFTFLTIIFFALFSCKKNSEIPTGSNKIEIKTTTLNDITYNSVVVVSDLVNPVSDVQIIQHGHCWSTEANPSTDEDHTSLGNKINQTSFQSKIENLISKTKYYIRAYVQIEGYIIYGNDVEFTTLEELKLPTVTTSNVTNITSNSAKCGGNVTSNGNGTVTSRGVCWDTTGNPTLENNTGLTNNGTGTGSFTSNLTSLNENTTYYVTAYATNEKGTSYGEAVRSFNTLELTLPTVTTSNVTNITSNSAQCGGDVTSNGNGTVSARGVCWDTTGNPTLGNCLGYTTDGTGTGSFTSNITSLEEYCTYCVAAYATNEEGTGYGIILSFMTLDDPCDGISSILYGGQIYHTVAIGYQCWLKENLNIGTRINGSQEQTDNGTIEKYCFDDNEANCNIYGGLYQWDEMMQYTITQGTQGICPNGWHIPTDEEWKILEGTVDSQYGVGDPVWDNSGFRGFDAGKNLKSTTGWYSNGNGTNDYGFTTLPGGCRDYDGNFSSIEEYAFFWSSTEYDSGGVWTRGLHYDADVVVRGNSGKAYGFSVRCVKD